MKKRLQFRFAAVLLVLSVLFVVWQAAFNPGPFNPSTPNQTFIFWAVTALVFLLIVTLLWILFREFVKLYIERQSRKEGSRIKTKLVIGALMLSCLPISFLVALNYGILNRNLGFRIREPEGNQLKLFESVTRTVDKEMQDETEAQAALLAALPETRRALGGGPRTPGFLEQFGRRYGLASAALYPPSGTALESWSAGRPPDAVHTIAARAPVEEGARQIGWVAVTAQMPLNIGDTRKFIRELSDQRTEMWETWKSMRRLYLMLMALITLFVLFVTTWVALQLSKQISVPIAALLEAAGEVSRGNLKHRVRVGAVDELGSLVRGFNQMTEELEANSRELERRRRFTEAILESIPTGVISIGPDGSIHRVNQALAKIFRPEQVARATRLEDLFSREDTAEIKYLMKRARRTGAASHQLELRTETSKLHLAVTVSALEEKLTSGFVVVLEDTSELLRAQKAAAWHEVARRVAHEIKNPLTPIALSAERIGRQLDRLDLPPGAARIVHECAATIAKSVESVKTLVDEFSQYARFPSAQPVRSDLNQVVAEALAVFKDRLDGITIQTSFGAGLPPVNLDREQFQRAVVNLVDNAAEAMQDALVKKLYIATQHGAAETVELVVADSGCGVSPDDKEKLFLPYFSTKRRGTGLGLAIVSHIVGEHNGHIRVEDNRPTGARFTVEIPALLEGEAAESARPAAAKV